MGNTWTYMREWGSPDKVILLNRDWWSPDKVILLKSPEGGALLNYAAVRQTLLIKIFSVQEKMGYCGIHSAALLMSAIHFGKKFPLPADQSDCDVSEVPYRDTNMFSFEQTSRVVNHEEVLTRGATLHEIQRLFQAHGVPTTKVYAKDVDVDTFRSRAIEALYNCDSSQGVLVNYLYTWKSDSGVVRLGHFSPLAAYHRNMDRFLLLDTWYEGRVEWVDTHEMFELMNTSDPDSDITRGFLISGLKE